MAVKRRHVSARHIAMKENPLVSKPNVVDSIIRTAVFFSFVPMGVDRKWATVDG
jgi:hypothetical protein